MPIHKCSCSLRHYSREGLRISSRKTLTVEDADFQQRYKSGTKQSRRVTAGVRKEGLLCHVNSSRYILLRYTFIAMCQASSEDKSHAVVNSNDIKEGLITVLVGLLCAFSGKPIKSQVRKDQAAIQWKQTILQLLHHICESRGERHFFSH